MKYVSVTMLFFLLFVSCGNDDECGDKVIISEDKYLNDHSSSFFFKQVTSDGTCVTVIVQDSGCDGETWTAELIDSGSEAESLPPQRSIRLTLKNKEECLAFVTQSFSFDLNGAMKNYDQMIFHLEGFEDPILVSR